jgi:hypothetical protein
VARKGAGATSKLGLYGLVLAILGPRFGAAICDQLGDQATVGSDDAEQARGSD